jgi:small subunit ribosomal protein S20
VANTKSAIKRMRQNEKRRLRNRTARSRVRSVLKTARTVVTTPGTEAQAAVLQAIRTLDKAVTKGLIHRNTAARKKSALARALSSAGRTSAAPRA